MDNVNDFLARFHEATSVDEVFTRGCCYWFAMIMYWRFSDNDAKIMYDDVANHFGTMINERVYDITGDVTDSYDWVLWDEITDELHRKVITRDCIMF